MIRRFVSLESKTFWVCANFRNWARQRVPLPLSPRGALTRMTDDGWRTSVPSGQRGTRERHGGCVMSWGECMLPAVLRLEAHELCVCACLRACVSAFRRGSGPDGQSLVPQARLNWLVLGTAGFLASL